ncbi:MAG TPA: choice-of-anchor D domain-containing protein [Thermoanaerobaculia bacterium]|nr:choice-of-anchor D domain-containing protein [Thermoanaerobaculia bacterium]
MSGANWYLIQAPTTPLAPGATTTFRVRIYATTAGTFTGTVSIASDDPASPFAFNVQATVVPPQAPNVQVSRAWDGVNVAKGSTVIYAGSVPAGTSDSRLFNLTNTGNATLNISNPNTLVSGANWYLIQAPTTPLAPGATTTFRVRIYSTSGGTFTGTVSIASDDPDDNPFNFNVQATVEAPLAPEIRVFREWDGGELQSGSSFVFPDIEPGLADSRLFRIQNDGTATLNLTNANSLVSGPCFYQIGDPVASSLAPGAVTYVRVRLLCAATGQQSGSLTIESNDSDESTFVVSLGGRVGSLPPIRVEAPGAAAVPYGSTFSYSDTGVGVPDSRLFTVYNDGTGPVTLAAPSGLVSGEGFYQIGDPPLASIPAGGSVQFRVRLYHLSVGTWTGHITLETTNPAERPFRFDVTGRTGIPDFTVTLSPASRSLLPGQGTSYTATVTPAFGFADPVSLSVAGLPASSSGIFTPTSVAPGTTANLQISTTAATPPGNSTLTITGTSGTLSHAATVSLTVRSASDFALAASPSLLSVEQGGSTTSSVSVSADTSISGGVNLSVSGLPKGATASFAPSNIQVGGTSTLTVTADASASQGIYDLTITGVGGGLTRTTTAQLRVSSNEKPILNRITPDSFVRGGTTRVRIEGQRLRGASVSIALEQPDPSDPVERYFPTAQLVSISADGTTMDVDIVASDQRILDFYNLVVDNGSGQEAIQFRVLPPGPLADAWSPANPAQGGLYALSIAGRHLAGTTVTPSVSGRVVLHGVETGESEITALLEVLPNAPAGPIDLLVRDAQGREVRVPITIEPPGNSLKRDFDLTARRGGEPAALAGGVAPPRILAQEFAVRDPDATENLENGIQVRAFDTQAHLERRSANSVSFGAYIRVRYTLIHAQWQKVIVYNPVTGELGAEILQALNIGQRVPLGAFVFSAYFNMDLTIYFGLTNTGFSFPRFCIELAYGAEITGFDGFAYAASFCVGGGWVAYGTASTVSSGQMDGGDCASVTPLGMQDGLLFGEVQQNRCCPQPISVAMSGRTFTGFSFGKNFSVSDPAAATTSSAVTQCPCTVQVDPATLTPSQPSSINAYVQNDSDQVATYNWTVQKTSGTTGVQFSPSSGTVTVNPHKVAAFAVSVSLPSGAPAPDTPEFSFSVTNTGCQSATTASACVYPDNETSTFEGWWTVEPSDVACFKGNLAPSSTSFSGRRVTEGNPNSGIGSFDNCYYTGSVYPNYAMENISGGNWQIVSGNRYNESDLIGFKCTKPPNQQCSFDTYYLQRHPTGCSVGTTQTMHMSCVNSATPDFSHSLAYQHNVLLIEATPNGTRITRDGTASPLH